MDIDEKGMRFSPHKNNSNNKSCCAFGCKSCAQKGYNHAFSYSTKNWLNESRNYE